MGIKSSSGPANKGLLWVIALSLLTLAICSIVFVTQLLLRESSGVTLMTNSPPEQPAAVIRERRAAFLERRSTAEKNAPGSQSMPGANVESIPMGESPAMSTQVTAEMAVYNGARIGASNNTAAPAPDGTNATGIIVGHVFLHGMPPPETPIDLTGSAYCSAAQGTPLTTRFFVVGTNGGLADVLVAAPTRDGMAVTSFAPPTTTNELRFTNCQIEPYISALTPGQKLVARNSDATFHSFDITPSRNPSSVIALTENSISRTLSFQKFELFMRVHCVVHPWEIAYVSVLPTPFFAVTDIEGRFAISNLPPGHYSVRAVHREPHRTNEVRRAINVSAGQTTTVDFTVEAPPH